MQQRCAIALLLIISCAAAWAQANPGQPGASRYTLELTPFATHRGTNAMDLTHAPDDSGRVFVSTQSGQVFAFDKDGNTLGTFLDLPQADPAFTFDAEARKPFKGLMYIAFHPDYAKQGAPGFGHFYTGYQVQLSDQPADFDSKDFGGKGDSDVRFALTQWRADPNNPDRIDPQSARRLMLLNFHTYDSNPHALGQIAFNPYAKPDEPDYAKLYIAVGDAHNGDYNKPYNLARAQQTDNPFAKILRIDPLPDGDMPYTIPQDNPFGTEVYATGLRDAQWFSFAKDLEGETVMLACDIGALLVEEINIIHAGGNYGWDRYEGVLSFTAERAVSDAARPPVVQYGHAFPTRLGEEPEGGPAAIMGGIVVSDPDSPSFQGQILFGDLPRGTLMHANYHHALTVEKNGQQSRPYIMNVKLGDKTGNFADVIGADRGDARFGFDAQGSIYVVSKQTDTIFKTRLVYTGLPVEAKPKVNKTDAGARWAQITIAGVVVVLVVVLGWTWRASKTRGAA